MRRGPGGATAAALTEAAVNLLPDPTVDGFVSALESLGSSYAPASTFGVRLESGRRAGAATYRHLVYDSGCSCFIYTSADQPL